MRARVICAWMAIVAAAPGASQDTWLKGFEGTWVVDGARGPDAAIMLTIVREKNDLVLKVALAGGEIQTRYGLTGADVTNANFGRKAIFRSRIDKEKLVTEIWENEAVGPPARIETRYLESADVMVTELSNIAGGPVFNRTALRRKPS